MGNVAGREQLWDDDPVSGLDPLGISSFEHVFAATLEDCTPGLVPEVEADADTRTIDGRRSSGDSSSKYSNEGRSVTVEMLSKEIEIRTAIGLKEVSLLTVQYGAIRRLTWDHARSSLKVGFGERTGEGSDPDDIFVSFHVENSLELELELKLRAKAEILRATSRGESSDPPASVYLGMFAGPTKPRPFQRKRPNLSPCVPEGVLPPLKDMRRWALEEHKGSARPVPVGSSLRSKLALNLVYEGENRFPLKAADGIYDKGDNCTPVYGEGELVMRFSGLEAQMVEGGLRKIPFKEIEDWSLLDLVGAGGSPISGLELWMASEEDESSEGDKNMGGHPDGSGDAGGQKHRAFLGISDDWILLARSAMEFLWNHHRKEQSLPPKAGSTQGRPVASVVTLRGEVPAPAPPTGLLDAVDLDGLPVRVGQVLKRQGQRHPLSPRALLGVEKRKALRSNLGAKSNWERTVLHQGWLRKRGGGAVKRWLQRYFVLYSTSQGHYLAYYRDVCDIPLFSEVHRERQMVDLCQVCFIRPETGRQSRGIPPNAFTLLTIERQWTLCADSQVGVQRWLKMISRAVDEDVAVVTDDEAVFSITVHRGLEEGRYGFEGLATAHVGSMGMRLLFEAGDSPAVGLWTRQASLDDSKEGTRFWGYTDFFKWTIVELSDGRLGLAVKCFTSQEFDEKEASKLAIAIEHHIEKFMAFMHLRMETDKDLLAAAKGRINPPAKGEGGAASTQPNTEQEQQATQGEKEGEQGGGNLAGEWDKEGGVEDTGSGVAIPDVPVLLPCRSTMNLAAIDKQWEGPGVLSPNRVVGRTPGGRVNPFSPDSDGKDIDDEDSDSDRDSNSNSNSSSEEEEACVLVPGEDLRFLGDEGDTDCDDKGLPVCPPKVFPGDSPKPIVLEEKLLGEYPPGHHPPSPPSVLMMPAVTPLNIVGDGEGGEVQEKDTQTTDLFPNTLRAHFPEDTSVPSKAADPESQSPTSRAFHFTGSGGSGIFDLASPRDAKVMSQSPCPASLVGSVPEGPGEGVGGIACAGEGAASLLQNLDIKSPRVGASRLSGLESNPFEGILASPEEEEHSLDPPDGEEVIHSHAPLTVSVTRMTKSEGGQCILSLLFDSQPKDHPVFNFSASLKDCAPALRVSCYPDIISPRTLGGDEGPVRQDLTFRCCRPFTSPPVLLLHLGMDGEQPPTPAREVALGQVTMSAFVQPLPMTADSFRQKWSALSDPAQSRREVFTVSSTLSGGPGPGEAFRAMMGQMGLAEVVGVGDPAMESGLGAGLELVAGAGLLRTAAMSAAGKNITVGCLVGLEVRHGSASGDYAVRLTVKSTNSMLAESLKGDIQPRLMNGC